MIAKSVGIPRVSFYTVGCRLNQAETSLLQDGFRRKGFVPVAYGQETDLLVVNSCTVTEGAESDCRRVVRQVLRHSPQAFVAVTGCFAQTGLQALRRVEGIDLIVGNQFKMRLPDILLPESPLTKQSTPLVQHGRIDQENFLLDGVGEYTTTRANLKIQDGCQFMCAFCLIPFARGRERSRVWEDVLREAEALVARGHRELVLTGVNIGQYEDRGRDLLRLIGDLEIIEGLDRIRISSIEPTTVPDTLLAHMAISKKLCRHLHVPLQSGDDGILQAMNRRYTIKEYRRSMEQALDYIPGLCFGTDIMVGFPGEGTREFQNTYQVVQELAFAYVHVFSYSPRPGTAALRLPDRVSPSVMKDRSRELHQLSALKRQAFDQQCLGHEVYVLFESEEKGGYWTGLTDHYVRVSVRSTTPLANQWLPVVITGVMGDRVVGFLQESAQPELPQPVNAGPVPFVDIS
ncbi:MAG: tRNA (N(6)-L-threonylcarbamoyladenosine(37)-C(2))-methylthiotransferase MtaB [Nitrospirales bacterium]|nr:tRNA (N(6)-L-threonylcarbamoyladenosine(37)-C(2))-methylthiotransferase MtaB [Nitrospirales bacterium]